MSSFSVNDTSCGFFEATRPTITHREHTSHWTTTALIRVRWSRSRWVMWSPSLRSVGFITATRAGSLPDLPPFRG